MVYVINCTFVWEEKKLFHSRAFRRLQLSRKRHKILTENCSAINFNSKLSQNVQIIGDCKKHWQDLQRLIKLTSISSCSLSRIDQNRCFLLRSNQHLISIFHRACHRNVSKWSTQAMPHAWQVTFIVVNCITPDVWLSFLFSPRNRSLQ